MAGQLKRENPTLREDVVLIRALRDSNLPKFLVDDARLFSVSALGVEKWRGRRREGGREGETPLGLTDSSSNVSQPDGVLL